MVRRASRRRVAHPLLQCPWSGWPQQKLPVLIELHHPQGLVLSSALRAGAGNTVEIPAIQGVTSQLGLVFVELGHGEVTKAEQTLSKIRARKSGANRPCAWDHTVIGSDNCWITESLPYFKSGGTSKQANQKQPKSSHHQNLEEKSSSEWLNTKMCSTQQPA